MHRLSSPTAARAAAFGAAFAAALCLLAAPGAHAQASDTAGAKPAAKPAAAKKAPKPTTSREQLRSEAKSLALATDTAEAATINQLDIAARVLTGKAECEFNQTVQVDPVTEQPGYFRVAFNKVSYMMSPEETTTGAVRLVDRKAGVVWLQIPVKSMLMNSKLGQRMVDACTLAEQRAAVEAVKDAVKTNSLE